MRERVNGARDAKTSDELSSLLEAYAARRLGFALVYSLGASRETGSIVSLSDVLELYRNKVIQTEMRVEAVASPAFSIPGETPLREALNTMLSKRIRRVFITGERRCVSDRDIIYEVFSPVVLDEIGETRKDPLAIAIGSIKGSSPELTSPRDLVQDVALRLGRQRGECLLTRKGAVVTPWDAVMKPWIAGKLRIAQP